MSNLLPNNQRQRRTCFALCHTLCPVSAAQTMFFSGWIRTPGEWRNTLLITASGRHNLVPFLFVHEYTWWYMTVGRFPLSFSCSRGTSPREVPFRCTYPSQRGHFQVQPFRYNLSGANLISAPLPDCRLRACLATPFHRSVAE